LFGYIQAMPSKSPYKIRPEQRSHRKKLSDTEPTVRKTFCLPKSLADWCQKIGPKKLRALLQRLKDDGN
jgi:hypothetical protein